jgi:cytidyltransferase-like protein
MTRSRGTNRMSEVIVLGSFDDLRAHHMRFLQEAAKLGSVHVLLLSDKAVEHREGKPPKFPAEERKYFVSAIRYVTQLTIVDHELPDSLPQSQVAPSTIWVVDETSDNPQKKDYCEANKLAYHIIQKEQLDGYPAPVAGDAEPPSGKPKVIVTGCYDWFHSGHVRFFEEVSELGELHVVVGHDANIELLKGKGHPMYGEDMRRYMAGSIRFVKRAYVSSGMGWLDAEPEMLTIKPDIYAVNEDGDVKEKREYCAAHGIEYRVLKRTPKEGLPKRQSTDLRGF